MAEETKNSRTDNKKQSISKEELDELRPRIDYLRSTSAQPKLKPTEKQSQLDFQMPDLLEDELDSDDGPESIQFGQNGGNGGTDESEAEDLDIIERFVQFTLRTDVQNYVFKVEGDVVSRSLEIDVQIHVPDNAFKS